LFAAHFLEGWEGYEGRVARGKEGKRGLNPPYIRNKDNPKS
jgi:hypothetical protein